MIDVATPLTFERTIHRQPEGGFEGRLLTAENAFTLMRPMPHTLPRFLNFFMRGQWVGPESKDSTGIMSARKLIKQSW
jgi:hypothetical protein